MNGVKKQSDTPNIHNLSIVRKWSLDPEARISNYVPIQDLGDMVYLISKNKFDHNFSMSQMLDFLKGVHDNDQYFLRQDPVWGNFSGAIRAIREFQRLPNNPELFRNLIRYLVLSIDFVHGGNVTRKKDFSGDQYKDSISFGRAYRCVRVGGALQYVYFEKMMDREDIRDSYMNSFLEKAADLLALYELNMDVMEKYMDEIRGVSVLVDGEYDD